MSAFFSKDKDETPGLGRVKTIIAIASGKGGVGKSTVAANLAVALKDQGATVGLMDADIYGPSQVGMLGSDGAQPKTGDGVLYPSEQHGIYFVSMGLLTDNDSPVIWRAPIAMKMIQQFLGSVVWGELDYLLIDLPPGTGDVQLTLAQQAQLSGAVIVTTPQEVALGIARKGLRMFEQVKVPIIGIIENMSGFTCPHCQKETAIFAKGGGETMSTSVGTTFLGSLPLDPEIMMSGDTGQPVLLKGKDSPAAKAILKVTANVVRRIKEVKEQVGERPKKYEVAANGNFDITWPDDSVSSFEPFYLRTNCPCAKCVDEDTGVRTLDAASIPLDIKIQGANPVGNYGVALQYSDGHNTGIYSFTWFNEKMGEAGKSEGEKFSV